jgi:hypothetical protein
VISGFSCPAALQVFKPAVRHLQSHDFAAPGDTNKYLVKNWQANKRRVQNSTYILRNSRLESLPKNRMDVIPSKCTFDRWYEALLEENIWREWMLNGLVKSMDIPTRNIS